MKLMSYSYDMRFQCYLLENADEAEFLARGISAFDAVPDPDFSEKEKSALINAAGMIGNRNRLHFVLWDAEAKHIIGRSQICFSDPSKPEFAYFGISEDMRGNRLVNLLYSAQFFYLQEMGYSGPISCTIEFNLDSSQKAVIRNGFTKAYDAGRYDFFQYHFAGFPPPESIEQNRERVFQEPHVR